MLLKNINKSIVSLSTGLTFEEIEKLLLKN